MSARTETRQRPDPGTGRRSSRLEQSRFRVVGAHPGLLLIVFLLTGALPLTAMDRWAALSQIESGDNDAAVGQAGEISRYQMKPDLWRAYASTNASWENPTDALAVAQAVMKDRCAEFQKEFHRAPTDLEFYVLWNAPAQVEAPSKIVRERAERFCNLVTRNSDSCPAP